jgi:hypothetical protein
VIRRTLPILLGVGLVLLMGWTARPAGSGLEWRIAFVATYAVGFVLLLVYLRSAAVSFRRLLVGAVLFRLAALPMLPSLSDDGYRYIWDGVVAVEAEMSPYAARPNNPALAEWQDEPIYARMNSPAYYSVYPPASQLLFRVAASVYSPWGWVASWWLLKGLLVAVELGGVLLFVRVVGAHAAALYAWSPLAVVEIAGQGHTEAVVVGGVGLLLAAAGSRFPVRSVGATVAGLAKLYPLALLPATWRRDGWRGILASVFIGVALTVAVWTPGAGEHVRESLGLFLGTFDAYAGPYRLLKSALYPAVGEGAGRVSSGLLAAIYVLAIAGGLLSDDGTRLALRRLTVLVVAGFVLATATFHPWYGLPVLMALPLLEHKKWLLWLAGWAPATYIGYEWEPAFLLTTAIGWGGAAMLLAAGGPRKAFRVRASR